MVKHGISPQYFLDEMSVDEIKAIVEAVTGKKINTETKPWGKKRFNYKAKKAQEWLAGISR